MDFVNANLGSALEPAILLVSTPNTEDVPSSDLRPARSAPRPSRGVVKAGPKHEHVHRAEGRRREVLVMSGREF